MVPFAYCHDFAIFFVSTFEWTFTQSHTNTHIYRYDKRQKTEWTRLSKLVLKCCGAKKFCVGIQMAVTPGAVCFDAAAIGCCQTLLALGLLLLLLLVSHLVVVRGCYSVLF